MYDCTRAVRPSSVHVRNVYFRCYQSILTAARQDISSGALAEGHCLDSVMSEEEEAGADLLPSETTVSPSFLWVDITSSMLLYARGMTASS